LKYLDLRKKSTFEPGHTSQWVMYFGTKNGANKLNLLGDYAPIQDYSFDYEIKTTTVNLGLPLSDLQIPYSFIKPNKLSLTVYETHQEEFLNFFKEYMQKIFKNKRVIPLNKLNEYGFDLVIEHFDKFGEHFKTIYVTILPNSNITKRGDSSASLNNLPIDFVVLGYSEKE